MSRSSAFSYSASRYSCAYSSSKTPESIQVDHLFREAKTPVFSPFANEIPKLPFEYVYRFTEHEYEYEKNQWYELPSTIMPDGQKIGSVWNLAEIIRLPSDPKKEKPEDSSPPGSGSFYPMRVFAVFSLRDTWPAVRTGRRFGNCIPIRCRTRRRP